MSLQASWQHFFVLLVQCCHERPSDSSLHLHWCCYASWVNECKLCIPVCTLKRLSELYISFYGCVPMSSLLPSSSSRAAPVSSTTLYFKACSQLRDVTGCSAKTQTSAIDCGGLSLVSAACDVLQSVNTDMFYFYLWQTHLF